MSTMKIPPFIEDDARARELLVIYPDGRFGFKIAKCPYEQAQAWVDNREACVDVLDRAAEFWRGKVAQS